jgi:hypothetical protein
MRLLPLDDDRIARGMRTQLAGRAARITGGDTAIESVTVRFSHG